MIVLPSDHLIKHNDIFKVTFVNACEVAESGANLVTVGITPNYPETGYGYIKYNKDNKEGVFLPIGSQRIFSSGIPGSCSLTSSL